MDISSQDNDLVTSAQKLLKKEQIPGGYVGSVACALRTTHGKVFTGVCLHLVSGLGFCAEATAISAAITNVSNLEIDTIVAVKTSGIVPPCGRCRELMHVISENSLNTYVIMSETEKVPLRELLPRAWEPTKKT